MIYRLHQGAPLTPLTAEKTRLEYNRKRIYISKYNEQIMVIFDDTDMTILFSDHFSVKYGRVIQVCPDTRLITQDDLGLL